MQAVLTPEEDMAKQRSRSTPPPPPPPPRGKIRIEFQAPARWVRDVDAAAAAMGGLSRADYIRIACQEKMARDKAGSP